MDSKIAENIEKAKNQRLTFLATEVEMPIQFNGTNATPFVRFLTKIQNDNIVSFDMNFSIGAITFDSVKNAVILIGAKCTYAKDYFISADYITIEPFGDSSAISANLSYFTARYLDEDITPPIDLLCNAEISKCQFFEDLKSNTITTISFHKGLETWRSDSDGYIKKPIKAILESLITKGEPLTSILR